MRVMPSGVALLLAVLAWPGAATAGPGGQRSSQAASETTRGQKVFLQNCGRCHNLPEVPSRREVRAVVRHMRVRANLSAEDEKALLQFLAP
jgi:hypothetical protein